MEETTSPVRFTALEALLHHMGYWLESNKGPKGLYWIKSKPPKGFASHNHEDWPTRLVTLLPDHRCAEHPEPVYSQSYVIGLFTRITDLTEDDGHHFLANLDKDGASEYPQPGL